MVSGEIKPEGDRLAQLAVLAQTLVEEIEGLAEDSGTQLVALSKRARTNRRLIVMTLTGFALDVALTVAIAFGMGQINALTQRLDVAQTTQRQKALCPLYQVFLDSRSAAGRAAAPDPAKYDHAFAVIEDGYKALECSAFISRTP